jgi:hypothetical protein
VSLGFLQRDRLRSIAKSGICSSAWQIWYSRPTQWEHINAMQHVTRSWRCAIIDELNSIASNKIEPSISEYQRSDLRQYYYQWSKGNSLLTFMVQWLKDLCRMHRGLHGFPWSDRRSFTGEEFSVMSIVFSNPRVTRLRDHDAWDVLVISTNTVWWYMREGNSSN